LLGLFWIEENRMKKWKNEQGEKCWNKSSIWKRKSIFGVVWHAFVHFTASKNTEPKIII
jgi:hypothetical protein